MKWFVVTVGVALAVGGCGVSSYAFSCNNGVCKVESSGSAEIDFEDEFGETLEVTNVEDDGVTLEVGSAKATIAPGQSDSVGPLQIEVQEISGNDVKLTVQD